MTKVNASYKIAATRELTACQLDAIVGGGSVARSDIEKILNVGSASSGAGAGKVTFKEFQIAR